MGMQFVKLVWVFLALTFIPFISYPQIPPSVQLEQTFALRDLLHRSYDHNVLKLSDVAVDSSKNEIYVAGIMTPHMAVLNGETDSIIRTENTGITDFQIKYLQCDETTRSLYIYNYSEQELYRYALDNIEADPAIIAVDTGFNFINDSKRNLLYRTSAAYPYLIFHDPITLQIQRLDCPAAAQMSEGAGPMILDATAERLYILDILRMKEAAQIYVINTADFTLTGTITLDIPNAQNPKEFARDDSGNFYVVTDRTLFSFTSAGTLIAKKALPVDQEFEDFVFNKQKQEVYILFRERPSDGRVDGIENLLIKYSGSTLIEGGSVSFGRKAHRMTLNEINGRIYIPNSDASIVWIITPESMTVNPLRIGDSLEQVVSGPSGSPLFMNSRLGGSYLVSYDPDLGTAEEFTAGTWPIPLRVSDDGNRLYVNNAWDGTLSIFQIQSTRTLLGTVSLDIPPGSTDRVPDMAIHESQGVAFIAYPEHHKIAVADLNTLQAAGTLDITSLCNENADEGGPGEVQLCIVEKHNRLFAYSQQKKLLNVYAITGTTASLLSTLSFDTTEMKWQKMNDAPGVGWFYYDSIADQLFLGPFLLNSETGEWQNETLPDVQRIFYRDDERELFWGNGLVSEKGVKYNTLYCISISDHTTLFSLRLREDLVAKPDFHFDATRNRLYVGYMIDAELDIYTISSSSASSATEADVNLPSLSTGSSDGTLAVRVNLPESARYQDGAPVLIWVKGGTAAGGFSSDVFPYVKDVVVITFLFPGGESGGLSSDGVYDYRGLHCIQALRDIILYAAGKLTDDQGRTIDDISSIPVLHNNIGLLGSSNGGNIVVAVAALYGAEFKDHLRYIIQWESPVCSQFATTDLGGFPIPCGTDSEYWYVVNPRYSAYGSQEVTIDYSNLRYQPTDMTHPIFQDGNDDGRYTVRIVDPTPCVTPDLNGDGILSLTEDFPLSAYTDGTKDIYSRQATQVFRDQGIFLTWPTTIASPEEANAFWDLREAVRLYESAFVNIPSLEGMILGSEIDHVQSAPDKPHLRQAFEGWKNRGQWVQINPSPNYLVEVNEKMASRSDLPNPTPNTPPADWTAVQTYCIPEDIATGIYQMAAVLQMSDRAYSAGGTTVSDWIAY